MWSDSDKVKALFGEFEELKKNGSKTKKEEIVKQLCEELTLHTLAEDTIVYPAPREAIDNMEIMDEANVEHAGAKELI